LGIVKADEAHANPHESDARCVDLSLSVSRGPPIDPRARVHQVELEMQNHALREDREQLEQSRVRYAHLYEYAPWDTSPSQGLD